MKSASGAFSFTMASTSDAANAFVHSSKTARASSFGPAIATDENDARMQTTDRDARMSSPKIARNPRGVLTYVSNQRQDGREAVGPLMAAARELARRRWTIYSRTSLSSKTG